MPTLRTLPTEEPVEKMSDPNLDRVLGILTVRLRKKSEELAYLRRCVLEVEVELDALAQDGDAVGAELERREIP